MFPPVPKAAKRENESFSNRRASTQLNSEASQIITDNKEIKDYESIGAKAAKLNLSSKFDKYRSKSHMRNAGDRDSQSLAHSRAASSMLGHFTQIDYQDNSRFTRIKEKYCGASPRLLEERNKQNEKLEKARDLVEQLKKNYKVNDMF